MKKHGYKANSFFRTGLDKIRAMLKMKARKWHRLIEKFIRWLSRKIIYYQQLKLLVG